MIKGLANLANNLLYAQQHGHSHFKGSYSNGYTAEVCFCTGFLYYYNACLLQITHDKIIINYTKWKGYSRSTTQALNTLKAIFPNAIIK